MFCDNCGRQLNDGAKFCDSCGARVGGADAQPVNQGYVQNTPQNMMYTQPVYMAPVQTARKPKSRAWIIIIIAVVVAAGIGVGLFFLLSPTTTLTVNGENIPMKESRYISIWGTSCIALMGEKGNDIYFVELWLEEGYPCANTTYNMKNKEDLGKFSIGFQHINKADNINVFVEPYSAGFSDAEVSVGNFTENERIGISASGKLSKDGREYEFSVSGEAKYSDYKEIFK